MKIWLDTTCQPMITGPECECPAPIYHRQSSVRSSPGIAEHTLCHPPSLYIEECQHEHWLISNPLRGEHIAVLDAPAYRLLQRFQTPTRLSQVRDSVSDCSAALVEQVVLLFVELGFLQESDTLPPVYHQEKAKILSAWLHVTNACNLRCDYCYLQKTTENMTNDTARKAVNAVFRSALKHHFSKVKLKYAGGEASLHMAQVVALHDYATERAQQYDIQLASVLLSNGIVLSQRSIDNLNARSIGIMISLDGIGAYHDNQRRFVHGQGSFCYVDRTIHKLLATNLIPQISVTVSQRNLAGLPALLEYILERSLPFTLSYYRDNECSLHLSDLRFAEEQMIEGMHAALAVVKRYLPRQPLLGSLLDRTNLSAPRRQTCTVGQNYLVIDQQGGVAKCHAAIKQVVSSIDAVDPLQQIREDHAGVQNIPVEDKSGCGTCQWRFWCTGGCPLLTYKVTGRYDIKSPNCNIYMALFPAVLHLEGLRLLKYLQPITFIENEGAETQERFVTR